jgi:hypothetical protein
MPSSTNVPPARKNLCENDPRPHDRGFKSAAFSVLARVVRLGIRSITLAALASTAWCQTQLPASWPKILDSVNMRPENLHIVVGEGNGVVATNERVTVRRIIDRHRPQIEIYWSEPKELPRYVLPAGATIFATERWSGAPMLAGIRNGKETTLWMAADPGAQGYERFPYLPQALAELGVQPKARASDLWAFFDSSYRLRADPEILARQWRQAGIGALHMAAWHYWEPHAERDTWLRRLIEICHLHSIQVYAWVELPHVSEKFWTDHPEWRERTGLLGDAHLDWRKLMNLQSRDCFQEVEHGLRELAQRFDWDGINMGELYFESLEGYSNPARFTPFNDDVRREFQKTAGFDPAELFTTRTKDTPAMRRFLNFRAELAGRMQREWMDVLSSIRRERPHIDIVLTHIDDRFDTQIPDLLGADTTKVLPLLDEHDFTFLVEDPATIWHMGPSRYDEIARRYALISRQQNKLAIDINVVERYQDVYPTKHATGVELFQTVHRAAHAFERVALYFEKSILPPDLPLLSASAAPVISISERDGGLSTDTKRDTWIAFDGPAQVNGRNWPIAANGFVLVPGGKNQITSGKPLALLVEDCSARVISAAGTAEGIEIEYESRTRARLRLNARPERILLDGKEFETPPREYNGKYGIALPPGRHKVYFAAAL